MAPPRDGAGVTAMAQGSASSRRVRWGKVGCTMLHAASGLRVSPAPVAAHA